MSASIAQARHLNLINDNHESNAAIDATGIETRHASLHFQHRVGRLKQPIWHSVWAKLTAVFDAATQLVTGVVVGFGPTQDSPQFAPAIRQAAQNLKPIRVLADKC